jgi:hypothetical protein
VCWRAAHAHHVGMWGVGAYGWQMAVAPRAMHGDEDESLRAALLLCCVVRAAGQAPTLHRTHGL